MTPDLRRYVVSVRIDRGKETPGWREIEALAANGPEAVAQALQQMDVKREHIWRVRAADLISEEPQKEDDVTTEAMDPGAMLLPQLEKERDRLRAKLSMMVATGYDVRRLQEISALIAAFRAEEDEAAQAAEDGKAEPESDERPQRPQVEPRYR